MLRRLSAALAHLDPDASRTIGDGAADNGASEGSTPDGAPTGSLESVLDQIEESAEQTGQRLEQAQTTVRRLLAALEQVAQGVVISDDTGEVVYRNWQAASFVGARHSEALAQQALAELLAAAAAGEGREQTLELFSPPRRTLTIRATPLTEGDATLGAVAIIEDVSERRRLEAVRRDFVANISHELKTPVGALSLVAETLEGEDDPAIVARLSHRMRTEAERLSRIIEDLLDLSRIESEESPSRDPVPVHLILGQAVERLRPTAQHRGIRLEVQEPPPELVIRGDRRQLVSAVHNLVDNAVKYSEDDSSVQVTVHEVDGWVEIAVADHGIGIPSRDLERIFERFYRVDRARSRDTGGTGLGLSIVRHVAGNHGGEVRVESREGEGSTFTLRLPGGAGIVTVQGVQGNVSKEASRG
ncbi:MAG TPA: ATP-binding protein [Acidimicrobiales bacterium]|nr:ATP-binding protein [Acidimicrobiales bacterium]